MPDELVPDFNIAQFARSRGEGRIRTQNPTLKMTSTRIEVSFNRIARLDDLADLAELLFPGNRNQQHAFLAVWLSLKWADHHMVPNLGQVAREHGITKRTLERVRAKMRRMGLIDHVSRFTKRYLIHVAAFGLGLNSAGVAWIRHTEGLRGCPGGLFLALRERGAIGLEGSTDCVGASGRRAGPDGAKRRPLSAGDLKLLGTDFFKGLLEVHFGLAWLTGSGQQNWPKIKSA